MTRVGGTCVASRGAIPPEFSLNAIAYVGDSPNDGSMFAHFPISVGVANVGAYLDGMADPPAFLCAQPGARGFAEFAARVLAARAR